ncbi:MAG TPA: winged helix-turn-helix domain-containing protein [Acidimicrobiia bacterium]|nr:winged helix-turn-helix domain-containing protein [Acidimicrobiia bacterium]
MDEQPQSGGWTLLTNHAHVLLCIAAQPTLRMREIAERSGITERAAHRIVSELEAAGFISHERVGRRNHYQIHDRSRSSHPMEHHIDFMDLVPDALLLTETGRSS